jgi:hypothetical protein
VSAAAQQQLRRSTCPKPCPPSVRTYEYAPFVACKAIAAGFKYDHEHYNTTISSSRFATGLPIILHLPKSWCNGLLPCQRQIALGALDKGPLAHLWTELFGVEMIGNYKSEKENVDEDILHLGKVRTTRDFLPVKLITCMMPGCIWD